MKNLLYLSLFVCLFACHSDASSSSYQGEHKEATQTIAEASDQSYQTTNKSSQTTERKIIKTADIRFQVKDLKTSTQRIETLAKQYNGLVTNMNQTNSNYSINNYLSIRIPSEQLDVFIANLEEESVFTDYTRIHSQDVTEEYLDINTRLATKKEVRDRYIEILRNKAKTVADILAAEDKIRIIQEEIEAAEGRLNYLKNKTDLSTINIEIYQEVAYVKSPTVYKKPYFTKLKEGFSNGWDLIQDITIGLVSIWPILLIGGFLFMIRKKIKLKIRK